MVDVLVKGDIGEIQKLSESVGGTFKYSRGTIAALKIPANSIGRFAESKDVTRIESYKRHLQLLNDTMRVRNNVNEVQQGRYPLTQGYDGDGILLGFIDSGVDYTHPDFKDESGHSRIQYIWDMAMPDSMNTPQPYGYGQEWTHAEIDAGTAGNESAERSFGHGTFVTGVGAGNGLAAGVNKGVAPKSDIIMVAYDFTYSGTDTRIADAVHYIFSKADALGKPCVINASLGDYYGSHDGQDLEAQLIDSYITAKKGRCLVAAAGNWGSLYLHLGYNASPTDTNFTWYATNNNRYVYIQMWGDSSAMKNIHFAVAAEDTAAHSIRALYPFSTATAHLNIDQKDTLYNGGNRIGIIETAGSVQGNAYGMEFFIKPDSLSYLWRLMITGIGRFDVWSTEHYKGALPTPVAYPAIVHYKRPDLDMNLSNSFACSEQVVTVANYVDRNRHYDCDDSLITTNEIAGELTGESSVGPTRDGRQKPDIAATGDHILSCAVMSFIPYFVSIHDPSLGLGCYHKVNGGTSAASPVVAGIAALYFQKYPNATNLDFKNAITGCAKKDWQTGTALPDYHWGYGKADAFHALTGCPPDKSKNSVYAEVNILPNPFSKATTIFLTGLAETSTKNLKLLIYDRMGKEVRRQSSDSREFVVEKGTLANGMYFFEVINGDQSVARGKMIIED